VKITRKHGAVQLRCEPIERAVLVQLFADLLSTLVPDDPAGRAAQGPGLDDPVLRRLYPDAYRDDAVAAAEYRELTESALAAERTERARTCIAELEESDNPIQLDAEAGQRWLRALNDLRLVLGTRLDVREDDREPIDPADPDAPQWAAYDWLTGVQDGLVRALMR
jgi:hypothetical protein